MIALAITNALGSAGSSGLSAHNADTCISVGIHNWPIVASHQGAVTDSTLYSDLSMGTHMVGSTPALGLAPYVHGVVINRYTPLFRYTSRYSSPSDTDLNNLQDCAR